MRFLPVHDSLKRLPVNSSSPFPRLERNRTFVTSFGWNFSLVAEKRSNSEGFLSDVDYFLTLSTPLMAIIGDSFVEAEHVPNRDTFHGLLAKKVKGQGRIYTFAAGGSPLSTYLAYADYARAIYRPQAMTFVIALNDFDESCRAKEGNHFFSKDEDWKLKLVNYEPGKFTFLRNSALLRYLVINLKTPKVRFLMYRLMGREQYGQSKEVVSYVPGPSTPERLAASRKAVELFLEALPEVTALSSNRILFVVDGIRPEIYTKEKRPALESTFPGIMRQYFIERAGEKGYETIDLQPRFIEDYDRRGVRFDWDVDLHWSPEGHTFVAEQMRNSNVFGELFNR